MRIAGWLAAAAAVMALVACGPGEVSVSTDNADGKVEVGKVRAGAKGDYNLEVFAVDSAKIVLVSGPDGKMVAARAADGQSAVMPVEEAKKLMDKHAGVLGHPTDSPESVKIRVPFVGIDVVTDQSGDNAKVRVNAGGQTVEVDANDSANAANVRVKGVDVATVRQFINDAEGLSAETKAEMLKTLGL